MSIREFHSALAGSAHGSTRLWVFGQLRLNEDLVAILNTAADTLGWPSWMTDDCSPDGCPDR